MSQALVYIADGPTQGTMLSKQPSHTNYFHEQLVHALSTVHDPADLKMIVLPSAATAASVRSAIARSGMGMVNLEALTPSGLALHVLKAMKPVRAARRVPRLQLECVVAAGLHERRDDPASTVFFRSVPALTRAIAADRLAGRDANWARQQAVGGAQAVYAELFAAYERFLEETNQLDDAAMQREALALAPLFRDERHLGMVLIASETPLLQAQVSLLNTLSQGTPRFLVGARDAAWPENCAAHLLDGWDGLQHDPGRQCPEPRILQAATRRDEVLMALTDMRARSVSVSEAVLAVTDKETYEPLIRAVASRLDIPVSVEPGNVQKRFSTFVATFLAWMDSKDESVLLADMVRSGVLAGVSEPARLAATLDAFPVTVAMLGRPLLREALMQAAELRNIPRGRINDLLSFLAEWRTHRWPSIIRPSQALEKLRESTKAMWAETEEWADAWEQVAAAFSDLQAAPDIPLPSRWLATRMSELLMRPQRKERDSGTHLQVCSIDEVGYGPRDHVWVLGLDDNASASAERQQPPHIAGMEVGTDESSAPLVRQYIAELRRRAGRHLTLCAPSYDVAEGRALFPSSALIEHGRIQNLQPIERSEYVDEADAYVPGLRGKRFIGVESGLEAMKARRSNQWTDWDGIVRPLSSRTDITLSASRLEMLATCPFKFWLAVELDVPRVAQASSEWLSAADSGLMLHRLFEEHARARMEERAGNGPEAEERMLLDLREALQLQSVRSESGMESAVALHHEDLSKAVSQYFRRERSLEGLRRPLHVEYQIHDANDPETPGIYIDLASGRISLSGRIDRIDQTNTGSWVVVDYKTGSWKAFVPARLKALEAKLQWALYSFAARRMSGQVVDKAEYVFTSRRGSGWVSAAEPPPEEALLALLEVLLQRYRSGAFIQAADKGGVCKWCDYQPVCADLDERKTQLREKFEHGNAGIGERYHDWHHKP